MNDTALDTDHDGAAEVLRYIRDRIEEEIEARGADKVYPYATDDDMQLRCFIFEELANSQDEIYPSIEHMEAVFLWIKDRTIPNKKAKKNADHLKPVDP